jgi:glutamate synthase domain-containing protein 3
MDSLNPDVLQRSAEPLDCDSLGTRAVNQALRALEPRGTAQVVAPRGRHNLAVGLHRPVAVRVEGNAGYFLGGLCGTKDGGGPDITVDGFVGWSVGENLMGGTIRVRGSASQSAGGSSSRAMPRCAPGSPSRARRWPSPATPAP